MIPKPSVSADPFDAPNPIDLTFAQQTKIETEKAVQIPVKKLSITQGYTIFHPGLDLDGLTGDPINPIMAGKVVGIQRSHINYGNAIIIDHGNEITSLYAHLSKIFVKIGDEVNSNTIIGLMGSTGRSTGDHLHLEVRVKGYSVNPRTIIPLK